MSDFDFPPLAALPEDPPRPRPPPPLPLPAPDARPRCCASWASQERFFVGKTWEGPMDFGVGRCWKLLLDEVDEVER